jgi:hypothetical protein
VRLAHGSPNHLPCHDAQANCCEGHYPSLGKLKLCKRSPADQQQQREDRNRRSSRERPDSGGEKGPTILEREGQVNDEECTARKSECFNRIDVDVRVDDPRAIVAADPFWRANKRRRSVRRC